MSRRRELDVPPGRAAARMVAGRGKTGPSAGVPTISVLTPVHRDHRAYLSQAYRSLDAQRMPAGWRWQWCVEEDGDDPGAVGGVVAGDPRVSYGAVGASRGPAECRNRALERAEGDLVVLLDADDVLDEDALAGYVDALASHGPPRRGAPHWAAAPVDDLWPDGSRTARPAGLAPGLVPPGRLADVFDATRVFPVHGAFVAIRTETLRAVGGFPAVSRSHDVFPLVAVSELRHGLVLDRVVGAYRRHAQQSSSRPSSLAVREWTHRRILRHASALRQLAGDTDGQGR